MLQSDYKFSIEEMFKSKFTLFTNEFEHLVLTKCLI